MGAVKPLKRREARIALILSALFLFFLAVYLILVFSGWAASATAILGTTIVALINCVAYIGVSNVMPVFWNWIKFRVFGTGLSAPARALELERARLMAVDD